MNKQRAILLSAVFSVAFLCMHSEGGEANAGYAALVRKVAPSVVTILVQEERQGAAQRAANRASADLDYDQMRSIMRRLLSGPGSNSPGPNDLGSVLGSGFVIGEDGLIITNRHVIVGARKIWVKLAGGKEVPAQLIGADAPTDIALLKVQAGPLPALRLGSSAKVSVGDPAIAIGNPFGLGQSVTAGIVSARGRALEDDPYIDFLQTDAAINLGNSGGPLLSADGTVIGVTSVILSQSGGSIGIGFAIPAETVVSVVAELKAHGRVDRGYLGVSGQAMTPTLARAFPALDSPSGALITSVDPHGPNATTLMVGDVLLSLGSTPVTYATLGKIVVRLRPGTSAEALIVRTGARQSVHLTIGQLPDPPGNPLQGGPDTWVPNLQLGVANATVEIRKELKADDEDAGLIVTQLRPDGAGALAGLRVGDLITDAGARHLTSVEDLATVTVPSTQMPLLVRFVRGGSPTYVAITGSEEH